MRTDRVVLHNSANRPLSYIAGGAALFLALLLGGCGEQTEKTEVKPPSDAATMQQAQQALPNNMPPEQRKKIEDSMRNSRSGAAPAAPSGN